MVNVPSFVSVPTFGSTAAKTQPPGATYSGGYLPGQVFPAEHENWFMAGLTENGNTEQTSLINVVSEMVTILTAAGITPNGSLTDQVYDALNDLYATVGALATTNSNLSTETTNRQNADTVLQNQITNIAPASGQVYENRAMATNITLPSIPVGASLVFMIQCTSGGVQIFLPAGTLFRVQALVFSGSSFLPGISTAFEATGGVSLIGGLSSGYACTGTIYRVS